MSDRTIGDACTAGCPRPVVGRVTFGPAQDAPLPTRRNPLKLAAQRTSAALGDLRRALADKAAAEAECVRLRAAAAELVASIKRLRACVNPLLVDAGRDASDPFRQKILAIQQEATDALKKAGVP